MSLPDPPLLVITDREQAAKPLPDMLDAVFAAGCRWASLREKDLPAAAQIALAKILLPVARIWQARLTLHGDPAIAKAALPGWTAMRDLPEPPRQTFREWWRSRPGAAR